MNQVGHPIARLAKCIKSLCLIFALTLIFTSCHKKETANNHSQLRINQVNSTFAQSLGIEVNNDFKIGPFSGSHSFQFDSNNHSVLLRIKVLDKTFQPTESTLVVMAGKLHSAFYFQLDEDNFIINPDLLDYTKPKPTYAYTAHQFAFNIDQDNLHNYHYILIQSSQRTQVEIALLSSETFIKHDSETAQLSAFLIGSIVALLLLSALLWGHSKDKTYLLFALFILSTLLALIWQNNLIHKIPWLAWPILGVNTVWVFITLSDLFNALLTFQLLNQKALNSKHHKILASIIGFRFIVIVMAFMQLHLTTGGLNTYVFNLVMTISLLLSYLSLIWLISKNKPLHNKSTRYVLISWLVMFGYQLIHSQHLFLMTTTQQIPMFEVIALLSGLLLLLAIASKNIQVKMNDESTSVIQHDELETTNPSDHSFLLKQFSFKMEQLANDASLNQTELVEKINIKLYLLLNRALPIKNSFIYEKGEITNICKTAFRGIDIEHIKSEVINNPQPEPYLVDGSSLSTDTTLPTLLFVPLSANLHPQTTMVFGLKKNTDSHLNYLKGITHFCDNAYSNLQHGRMLCNKALEKNTDAATGLFNSKGINAIIKKSLKKGHVTVAAMIEIANLQDIKNQYSEYVYNQCLIEYSNQMAAALQIPVKLGRLNESLFIAVFSSVETNTCEKALHVLIQTIETAGFTEHKLKINLNIGLSESHMNETRKSLLKKATFALSHISRTGPNKMIEYDSARTLTNSNQSH